MSKLDAWHLNALLLKELSICWRDNKTVIMSLGSDSVCFQMILTELANKGYETGLQFDSLYSKKLESHHLNMTQFTSVTQDPKCWNGLSTNPLSWQAQPIYHFQTSLLCLTWFKNRCRVNLELEEAWACHSLIIIPTVERLRGSLWPFSAANKVVFPRPWKKKATKEHTKPVFDGILTGIFRFPIFMKKFSIVVG